MYPKSLSLACLLLLSGSVSLTVFAGIDPEYSDIYPRLSLISQHGSSIFFSGSWQGRGVVVRFNAGRWTTFVDTLRYGNPWRTFDVKRIGLRVCMSFDTFGRAFDLRRLKWSALPESLMVEREKDERRLVSTDGGTLVLGKGKGAKKYTLIPPSAHAYARWRGIPYPYVNYQAHLGTPVRIGNKIWFLITFYDSEGTTGIGGLAVFDCDARRFGVVRSKHLASCSAGCLSAAGDILIIGTARDEEYGIENDKGLVLVNTLTGATAHVAPTENYLGGRRFNDIKVFDKTVWMITERGITGWDLDKGKWFNTRADSVLVESPAHLFRWTSETQAVEERALVPVVKIRPGAKLAYRFLKGAHIEVDGRQAYEGWVTRELWDFVQSISDEWPERPGITLFSDSGTKVPYNRFVYSPAQVVRTVGRLKKVRTAGAWLRTDRVHPVYSQSAETSDVSLTWDPIQPDTLSLLERAFREYDRERSEPAERIPVYQTTMTARAGEDIYVQWSKHNLPFFVQWRPEKAKKHPSGIWMRYRGANGQDDSSCIAVANGNLLLNGKKILRGKTWSFEERGFYKADFTLMDFSTSHAAPSELGSLSLGYRLYIPQLRTRE